MTLKKSHQSSQWCHVAPGSYPQANREESEIEVQTLVEAALTAEEGAHRLFVFLARANGRKKDLILAADGIPRLMR